MQYLTFLELMLTYSELYVNQGLLNRSQSPYKWFSLFPSLASLVLVLFTNPKSIFTQSDIWVLLNRDFFPIQDIMEFDYLNGK